MCGFHEREVLVVGAGDVGRAVLRDLELALDRTRWPPLPWRDAIRLVPIRQVGVGGHDPGEMVVLAAASADLLSATAELQGRLDLAYTASFGAAWVHVGVGSGPPTRPGELRANLSDAVRIVRALAEWSALRPFGDDDLGLNGIDFFALAHALKGRLRFELGGAGAATGAFVHAEMGGGADPQAILDSFVGAAGAAVVCTGGDPALPLRIWSDGSASDRSRS